MKKWTLIFSCIFPLLAFGEEAVPDSVNLEGKFQFKMLDGSGQLHLGQYIDSVTSMSSASLCRLDIVADDEFYNTYPSGLELSTIDNGPVIPVFDIKSLYIDENSRYWNKKIKSASFFVADINANEGTWIRYSHKDSFILFSKVSDDGVSAYHHLTMGHPLRIVLTKEGKPSQVTINVKPLSLKLASIARKCMKLISNDS